MGGELPAACGQRYRRGFGGVLALVAAVARSPVRMGPSPRTAQVMSRTGLLGLAAAAVPAGEELPGPVGVCVSQVTARSTRWVLASSQQVGSCPQLEFVGEVGQVFQGLALAFGERVVRHPRPGMKPGNPKIGEQRRNGFGGHRGAPISVHGVRGGTVAVDGLGDEIRRHFPIVSSVGRLP